MTPEQFCALAYAGSALCAVLALWIFTTGIISKRNIPRQGGREYLVRRGRQQTEDDAIRDRMRGTWRVRLHHFVGPDDAGHHNHPFAWSFSIVLWGSYTEEVLRLTWLPGGNWWHEETRTRRVRLFNWIPITKYHRITKLHGNVWTLFFCGPRVGEWGFWDSERGRHIPHATYSAEHGNISTLE